MSDRAEANDLVPPVADWFQNVFHRFLRRVLKRHFHAIAVESQTRNHSIPADAPLIVYGNHPSWWDPLIAHFLNRTLLEGRQFFAPIDAKALERYKVFGKLGFYGVQLQTNSGAANFLKTSTAILNAPNTAIWMTPEGRFSDVRDHDAKLMPGLSHLCNKQQTGFALPLALEYVFWEERLPECLAQLGQPIAIRDHLDKDKSQWDEFLTDELRRTQSRLSELAIARSSEPFDNLLSGRRGAGGIYDNVRRVKSWVTGSRFRAAHGDQFE